MDTTTRTTRQHRNAGRGRKAFWVAIALGGLVAAAWLTPIRAQRSHGPGAIFHGHRATTHSLATLGSELREHERLLTYAGLTAPQVERIASVIEQRSALFAELEAGRGTLEQRLADAVAAETVDLGELAVTLGEAKNLADRSLDELFDLIAAIAGELTPEQRADLVTHWSNR